MSRLRKIASKHYPAAAQRTPGGTANGTGFTQISRWYVGNDFRLCVVLNNQHSVHIDEFAKRWSRDGTGRAVLQPHAEKRLLKLRAAVDDADHPLPVFLVEGRFKHHVAAEGLLHEVRFEENLSRTEKVDYRKLISRSDTSLYGRTLIVVSNIHRLPKQIALRTFRKVSDNEPLTPGSWPASVCILPAGVHRGFDRDVEAALDETVSAVEGELRMRLVKHRSREQKLRRSKIAAAMRQDHRLRCEVTGCGFDFFAQYGSLGQEYALVHHLNSLAGRAKAGHTPLNELAIVCANCHAMIHQGGECRSLKTIAAAIRSAKLGAPAN
jgi:hypothetical protein